MWVYEKKLQYPVKIKNPNASLAKIIMSQYGGAYFKKIYPKSKKIIQYHYSVYTEQPCSKTL